MEPHLHIICFDNPFPPSYGGAIDVFYRVKALSEAGVSITLHCYYKGDLHRAEALESLCLTVYYYPRKTGLMQHLSGRPYGVKSRSDKQLLRRLLEDQDPILFEGLVSCDLMSHPALRNRRKLFRECNIEHDYYHALGKASHSLWKKLFYHLEAWRLKRFERNVRYATEIWALSHQDEAYFRATYPQVVTRYVPCAHGHTEVRIPEGLGQPYILYHGNLAVEENEKAALYILRHLENDLPLPLIIAGKAPSARLRRIIAEHKRVQLVENPDSEQMEQLIRDARIHLLITFQATGIKLKLLNVLYNGRHIIVNPLMVAGTDYAPLCHIGHDDAQLISLCNSYAHCPVTQEECRQRETLLTHQYATIIPPIV